MQDEKQILLQQERAQRVKELLEMRKHDKALGVERIEVENPLLSINRRIVEYISILPFSLEFLIIQTVLDFKTHYVVLQNKKLDYSKPVLMLRNDKNTKVYANKEITKEQIRSELNSIQVEAVTYTERDKLAAERIMLFIREEFYTP